METVLFEPLTGIPLLQRAAGIQMVVMDVDGVLTNGQIAYTSDGHEIKTFNVKDGLGISLGLRAGLEFGVITARESLMVHRRMTELGIQHIIQNTRTKLPAFEALVKKQKLSFEQVAYIGDDLPDLPPMAVAGLSACPLDAADALKSRAHLVSRSRGGDGAVREILDLILECRQWSSELSHL